MINNTFTASNSAFIYEGNEYRNLEAQVQKNKEDIAKHYAIDRVLADFGIRVIGQVDTAEELPDPETYEGEYGDAFAVGSSEPYDFYIWTRPSIDGGNPNPYWFNIGELAIVGPQGPQGEPGPQGPTGTGTQILTGTAVPGRGTDTKNAAVGSLYIRTGTGDIYRKESTGSWSVVGSIKGAQGETGPQGATGPQGPRGEQGPQGPQGTPGQSVEIVGIVSTNMQLPLPTTVSRTAAYLVGSTGNYSLYVITGTDSNLAWDNLGPFNTGTQVTVNNTPVSVLNADEYLKAPANFSTKNYVCLARYDNALGTIAYAQSASNGYLVQRTSNGQINLPNQLSYEPTDNQAVSKFWVNDALSTAEENMYRSPYRIPQKAIFTASSGYDRYLSNLLSYTNSYNFMVDGAEALIYFPGSQGSLTISDTSASSAEDDVQIPQYTWTPSTGARWAVINVECTTYDTVTGYEYTISLRTGDGKSWTTTHTTSGDIVYNLYDQEFGNTGSPYREEITLYHLMDTSDTTSFNNYPS